MTLKLENKWSFGVNFTIKDRPLNIWDVLDDVLPKLRRKSVTSKLSYQSTSGIFLAYNAKRITYSGIT